jgi:hypothetical protein
VQPTGNFSYTVNFENESSATAPAQTVTVTEQLDPNLDWSTFQLGDIGFGTFLVSVPPGRTSFSTRVDATATLGVFVDVTANFNLKTGVATWTFTALDPTTLDLPMNLLAGLLPPNKNEPQGQGFVSYMVNPKAGLATGTRINAQASVVFDTNAPVNTAPLFNTIDSGPPTSSVNPQPAVTNTASFPVSWSGQDDPGGSGIASFDVYASTDGGAFKPFLLGTTQTSATFIGAFSHTYGFYSIATDNVGNMQASKTTADTHTTVSATITGPPLAPELRYIQGLYVAALGRVGSVAELDGWVAFEKLPGQSHYSAARAIEHSWEARTHLVRSWYVNYLARQAAGGEEQGWVQSLLRGASEDQIQAQIMASPEFAEHAHALIGSADTQANYIGALYRILFGRVPSPVEVTAWLQALPSFGAQPLRLSSWLRNFGILPGQSYAGLALAFLESTEYRQLRIAEDYAVLLGRNATSPEAQAWDHGPFDLATVRYFIESSNEFYLHA